MLDPNLRAMLLMATGTCLSLVVGCRASPSITVDTNGLGDSAVAQVIKQHWMINPEKSIQSNVQALIAQEGPAGRTQEGLERMGFQCVTRQTIQCIYTGHLVRILSGLPKDTKADAVVRLDIRIETTLDAHATSVTVTAKETPINS